MKKQNIPITRDFNQKNIIGSANISIDDATIQLIANGLLTFSVGYIAPFQEDTEGIIEYKRDVELIELSLIPTQNYVNHLKQKGLYNDNNNNIDGI